MTEETPVDMDAVAALCGLRAEETPLDTAAEEGGAEQCDENPRQCLVMRRGFVVEVLVSDHGAMASLCAVEAVRLCKTLVRAAEDANTFQKAYLKWSAARKEKEPDIRGELEEVSFAFKADGKTFKVAFSVRYGIRTARISREGDLLAVRLSKDTELTLRAAKNVLRAFLLERQTEGGAAPTENAPEEGEDA